jgi:propionyl-CoA carboxylase beta chain
VLLRSSIALNWAIRKRSRSARKDYENRFANPFVAAERGYIDDVIRPHSTRRRVSKALALLRAKKVETPWKKHDNIPL